MYIGLRVTCPLFWSEFNDNRFTNNFGKYMYIKFHENLSSGNPVVLYGRIDGQTDMPKIVTVFRHFPIGPKNSTFCPHSLSVLMDLRTNSDYFPIQH